MERTRPTLLQIAKLNLSILELLKDCRVYDSAEKQLIEAVIYRTKEAIEHSDPMNMEPFKK